MPRFCTLQTVRRSEHLIKASIFDDQILIFIHNEATMDNEFRVFYSEETAHYFIEGLLDNDQDS